MRSAAGGWKRPCTAREVPRRTGSTRSNIYRESQTRAFFTTLLQKLPVWCTVTKQFYEQLAKEWKIKCTHMRVLNRIVRIHPRRGITMEPDPRHAEILSRDLDGKSGRAGVSGINHRRGRALVCISRQRLGRTEEHVDPHPVGA